MEKYFEEIEAAAQEAAEGIYEDAFIGALQNEVNTLREFAEAIRREIDSKYGEEVADNLIKKAYEWL